MLKDFRLIVNILSWVVKAPSCVTLTEKCPQGRTLDPGVLVLKQQKRICVKSEEESFRFPERDRHCPASEGTSIRSGINLMNNEETWEVWSSWDGGKSRKDLQILDFESIPRFSRFSRLCLCSFRNLHRFIFVSKRVKSSGLRASHHV